MIYDVDKNTQDDVSFGNKANIIETRTLRRVQPLHFGVNYNKKPLEFTLVFGAEKEFDRYEMQTVANWLTGHQQYQIMTIDQPDMEHIYYKCLIEELTPIYNVWLPFAYEAKVVCDCPYAYGYELTNDYDISGETQILFRNESSVREFIKPKLTFIPASGTTSLKITNTNDNDRVFLLESIPSGCEIYVDNNNGILEDKTSGVNLYPGFNLNFFRFVGGDNNLTVEGDGKLSLTYQFMYNVGA